MAITTHEVFLPPSNLDVPVWRYMDFTKFVSMLVNRGLYFARVDKLGDPFEGSLPAKSIPSFVPDLPPGMADEDQEKLRSALTKSHDDFRLRTKGLRHWAFASCWHMSEHESAAMWRLYAQTKEAVSIRSTFSKLAAALPDDIFVGQVHYVDYEKDTLPFGNILWRLMHKRKSFEHEREIRALVVDLSAGLSGPAVEPTETHLWKEIDLANVLDQVCVAPTAPEWFRDTVTATIKAFNFDFPVCKSALDRDPLY